MMDKQRVLENVCLVIIVFLFAWLLFSKNEKINERIVTVEKVDTIVEYKKDFDTVWVKDIKYNNIYKYDTLHIYDTINRQEKIYIRDSLLQYDFKKKEYDLHIAAVKLDNYQLSIHAKDTIFKEITTTKEKYNKHRFIPQIGIYGGIGYNFQEKTFGPEVGIGITIPLTNW